MTFDQGLDSIQTTLNEFEAHLIAEKDKLIGYPCNGDFNYEALYRFLAYPINNIGDPYVPSNYHLNTHRFELEVLNFFEELTQAPAGQTWGYVTNGGTEGNHYGLFLAREILPDGIVYYSQETHYSVGKILRCLNLPSIMIRSNSDGTMDLNDLRESLRLNRTNPPIICANVGTTMKGAVDDIDGINAIFQDLAIPRKYLHADCALSGMILPFVNDAPAWNFAHGVDSLSISGHKMIGSPIPCGVVLAKKDNMTRIAQSVEYIGSMDTTLTGSRNGIAPLFLWYAIKKFGQSGFCQLIQQCLERAEYAVRELNKAGQHAWRHPYSNTVVFDRPLQSVVETWQLATHGPVSHLITMPNVTTDQVDRLVADIKAKPVAASQPSSSRLVPIGSTGERTQPSQEIILIGSSGVDLLDAVATAMGNAGISILDMKSSSIDEGCLLILTVEERDRAIEIINLLINENKYGSARVAICDHDSSVISQMNFSQAGNDSALVKIDDHAGALGSLTHRCQQAGIKLNSARIVWRGDKSTVLELTTPNSGELNQILDASQILMLPAQG